MIPGHGSLGNMVDLKADRDMLSGVADRIKTLEQVSAAKPAAEFNAAWGSGFIKPQKWVEILYENLQS